MKKMQLLVAVTAVLLAGCATSNVPGVASYSAVSSFAYVGVAPTSRSAEPFTVIAKRDPGKLGVMLASVLTIDGKSIAPIKPGEYVELKLDPGEKAGERLRGVHRHEAWVHVLPANVP